MRILFLSKRQPQQRDLLDRPYGRFFHLPTKMAELGHEVHVALIGHRGDADVDRKVGGVQWTARDFRSRSPASVAQHLIATCESIQPDWIIACSDAWVACIGLWLSSHSRARLAVDAYDDFESYMPWNIPLHLAYRLSVAKADLVTAAGPQLATYLQRHRKSGRTAEVLPMAADPAFVPMDRDLCRRKLKLPERAPLVGYTGSWAANRGTDLIPRMMDIVSAQCPSARLVVTGNPPEEIRRRSDVIPLGYIDDHLLPVAINAVNVACIVTADTQFGRHSYPAKLCEAMACGVPVIATCTGPVEWMLARFPQQIVPLSETEAFARAVLENLERDRLDYSPLPSWSSVAAKLELLLS